MEFTEKELDIIFSKAVPVLGEQGFSKDRHGNIILRSAYGMSDDPFGWEIDHTGIDNGNNTVTVDDLQPLHVSEMKYWENI